jgi:hypothetical protein
LSGLQFQTSDLVNESRDSNAVSKSDFETSNGSKKKPMSRTNIKSESLCHAFDAWTLDNVASLIDAVADGEPPGKKTMAQIRAAARSDVAMLRRLTKLAAAVLAKYDRGELTQEEALRLNKMNEVP